MEPDSVQVLRASWEDLALLCSPQIIPNSAWMIGIWISDTQIMPTNAIARFNHLSIRFRPTLFQQIVPNPLPLPPGYETEVTNPGILHLAQLLHTEMYQSQILSELFVASIVRVLTLHLVAQQESAGFE